MNTFALWEVSQQFQLWSANVLQQVTLVTAAALAGSFFLRRAPALRYGVLCSALVLPSGDFSSNNKVSDVAMMRQQNEIFRKHAFDSFSQTLGKAAKDSAMLLWLDAESNRKQHPNENLAREIMELFALGVGNYTEQDIKEAARALTGWSVNKGQFRDYDKYHDEGEKTIFGKRGTWRGDDLLRLLTEHAATPGRVAFRVTEMLMGETSRDEALLVTLASGLREHDLDVSWAVETLLRSRLFFENRNLGNRVLSPVEYVVGVTRSLQYLDPPPSTLLLAETTANLGQDLFNPPNVFGWPGGRAWLTSRTMIARANFATSFVNGELSTRRASAEDGTAKLNAAELAESYGFEKPNEQVTFFSQLLLGRDHSPPRLKAFSKDVNQLVAAILASPEAQLA